MSVPYYKNPRYAIGFGLLLAEAVTRRQSYIERQLATDPSASTEESARRVQLATELDTIVAPAAATSWRAVAAGASVHVDLLRVLRAQTRYSSPAASAARAGALVGRAVHKLGVAWNSYLNLAPGTRLGGPTGVDWNAFLGESAVARKDSGEAVKQLLNVWSSGRAEPWEPTAADSLARYAAPWMLADQHGLEHPTWLAFRAIAAIGNEPEVTTRALDFVRERFPVS